MPAAGNLGQRVSGLRRLQRHREVRELDYDVAGESALPDQSRRGPGASRWRSDVHTANVLNVGVGRLRLSENYAGNRLWSLAAAELYFRRRARRLGPATRVRQPLQPVLAGASGRTECGTARGCAGHLCALIAGEHRDDDANVDSVPSGSRGQALIETLVGRDRSGSVRAAARLARQGPDDPAGDDRGLARAGLRVRGAARGPASVGGPSGARRRTAPSRLRAGRSAASSAEDRMADDPPAAERNPLVDRSPQPRTDRTLQRHRRARRCQPFDAGLSLPRRHRVDRRRDAAQLLSDVAGPGRFGLDIGGGLVAARVQLSASAALRPPTSAGSSLDSARIHAAPPCSPTRGTRSARPYAGGRSVESRVGRGRQLTSLYEASIDARYAAGARIHRLMGLIGLEPSADAFRYHDARPRRASRRPDRRGSRRAGGAAMRCPMRIRGVLRCSPAAVARPLVAGFAAAA